MNETEIIDGKIIVYPTRTVIEPYLERNAKIEAQFNVWNEVTHKYDFQAYIKDEANNRLIIPTGFSPYELKYLYPSYRIEDKRKMCEDYMNANKELKPVKMNFDCRDDIQKNALKFLNKKDNIKDKFKSMQRYLCLKTGEGKTFCAVKYIVDNRDRPIIFVDQESLGSQWENRILQYTDAKPENIFYISGASSIKKLMKMSVEEILSIKFFICCYRTLTNNLKNNAGSSEIKDLFNHLKITLKIFDEAHVEYMSIFKMDMISNTRSIYLSATPKRSAPNEDKVYQRMFKHVDKHFSGVSEESIENYHNIILFHWNSKPELIQQASCSNKYGFSMAKYCSYLENNRYDQFEEAVYKVLFDCVLANRKKKKTAILFGTLALLNKFDEGLKTYIKTQGYKLVVEKFSGETKKEDKLEILEKADIILTTDKSFSKGMDVKDLRVLINTVPFSSDTKLTQVVGRLRRIPDKEVTFIDINDYGFDSIKRQLATKKKEVYNVIAKKIFEGEI